MSAPKMLVFVLIFCVSGHLSADDSLCLEELQIQRVYEILESINVDGEQIKICVFKTNEQYSYIDVSRSHDIWTISMTSYLLDTFPEIALKGALAHELGHINVMLLPDGRVIQGTEMIDQQADAFAIEIAGSDALYATYVEHTGNKNLARRRVNRAEKIRCAKTTLCANPH